MAVTAGPGFDSKPMADQSRPYLGSELGLERAPQPRARAEVVAEHVRHRVPAFGVDIARVRHRQVLVLMDPADDGRP